MKTRIVTVHKEPTRLGHLRAGQYFRFPATGRVALRIPGGYVFLCNGEHDKIVGDSQLQAEVILLIPRDEVVFTEAA